MDEREEVVTYVINRWDCPTCGEVHETDSELSGDDECDHCGLKVTLK